MKKKSGLVLGSIIALTLVFYLLAYFFLPPPPPTAPLMLLFAGVAIALVSLAQALYTRRKAALHRLQEPGAAKAPKSPGASKSLSLACALVLTPLSVSHASAQQAPPLSGQPPLSLTCIANPSAASPNLAIDILLSSLATNPRQRPLRYAWDASSGTIQPSGVVPGSATLRLQGLAPGSRVAIRCRVADDQGNTADASTDVMILQAFYSGPPPPQPPVRGGAPTGGGVPPSHQTASGGSPSGGSGPPADVQSSRPGTASTGAAPPRLTGTALLLPPQTEDAGYGLTSYALVGQAPTPDARPRYRAFFRALLDLPTAGSLSAYVPKSHINVTYIPLADVPPPFILASRETEADYLLDHYDYARGAVLLATLPGRTGPGPVIVSVLTPIRYGQRPRPVLVQDLSTAQPVLMADYVADFKQRVAREQFWAPETLAAFSLSLRNVLETAAIGLGMSQDAVHSWVQFSK
ncbi:MAG TPA: hypothetical protein VGD62_08670 [Acidobacteriaceae bacterium]